LPGRCANLLAALTCRLTTLAVLSASKGLSTLIRWAPTRIARRVPLIPIQPLNLGGGITIGLDQAINGGESRLVLTVLLWAGYRFTGIGVSIRAAAENERAAANWAFHRALWDG